MISTASISRRLDQSLTYPQRVLRAADRQTRRELGLETIGGHAVDPVVARIIRRPDRVGDHFLAQRVRRRDERPQQGGRAHTLAVIGDQHDLGPLECRRQLNVQLRLDDRRDRVPRLIVDTDHLLWMTVLHRPMYRSFNVVGRSSSGSTS